MDKLFSVVSACTLHTLLHIHTYAYVACILLHLDIETAHVVMPDGEVWTT